MADFTLNGHPCTAAQLTIPGTGLWFASVVLAEEVALSGAVTLTVLDTTWRGFVLAGAALDGKSRYRIAAGAGGWGKSLPPRAYANDAGVTVAQLVADLATEAGEPAPVGAPTTALGPHFVRQAAPASFSLNLFAGPLAGSSAPAGARGWYARPDGVVAFGTRPAGTFNLAPVVERNPSSRVLTLALSNTAANLLPGVQSEFGAISDIDIDLSEEGVRAHLYAAPTPGRRAQAYAKIFDSIDPGRRYRGVFEYRVVSQTGERLNLQPVRARAQLPDLARVPVRAGVPGVKATHSPGSQVLVAFLDADATRPVVVGFDAPDQPGWMPADLTLGSAPVFGVARLTDTVQAGPFAGVITGASARVKAAL